MASTNNSVMTFIHNMTTFMDQCFRGFSDYIYSTQALSKMAPEQRELFLSTYRNSLGLSESNLSEHIAKYQTARAAALANIPDIPFDQKPTKLQDVFASFKALDEAIKEIGARYHPDNLTHYLEEERQKAVGVIQQGVPPNQREIKGAIIQQYEEDVALIEATQTDPIKKKNALETLKSAHQAQLKALEDGIKKDIDKLHKAVEEERHRVSTFAVLRHENEYMKKAFDRAFLGKKNDNVSVALGGEGAIFKDLDFESIFSYVNDNFKTLTGRDIKAEKKGTNPVTYELKLNFPGISTFDKLTEGFSTGKFNFGYYTDKSNRAMQDILTMATLLKLSGQEKPCATITTENNPVLAMRLAQDAYTALRMAGYQEDKIKIIVDGKVYTSADKDNSFNALFKDNPYKKQEAEVLIQKHQQKNEPEAYDSMKSEMDRERNKHLSQATSPTGAAGPVKSN
jgi:hypothetical protein